jgi:holo-[acyl-carrier protein] synthase
MVLGLGTDIIEIKRIERLTQSQSFYRRFFTDNELKYLLSKKVESTAGYFCAKEAVVKALGTGFSGIGYKDVEIVKINSVPCVVLHENALRIAKTKGIEKIHLSITHCREYAAATAVAEG